MRYAASLRRVFAQTLNPTSPSLRLSELPEELSSAGEEDCFGVVVW